MQLKRIFTPLVLFLLCTCATAQQVNYKLLGKKGRLLWKDEFNGSGLPDSSKWGYEEGFVRNNEKQFYTKARIENCYEKDGNLVIESKKENYKDAAYTSASINTLGKHSFKGKIRIEVRAKLPEGRGIWPAIWMMGANGPEVGWPRCSEIDIMEFVGHIPKTVWGTLHWWDSTSTESKKNLSKGSKLLFDDLHTNFHVYGMERRGNRIQLFVDDHYYLDFTVPSTAYPASFTEPLYLLLNTAIGGDWGGPIDDSIFPQKFYIDYVRVYKLRK
ncbi:MAG TPA: glycoside hydrolase family 16 protein [Hanamia sp.]